MRKLLLLILLSVTGFTLTTCSDNGTGVHNETEGGNEEGTPEYNVTVSVTPSEAGSVSPAPDGTYEEGEEVKLQANAKEGYRFSGWSGDIESHDNPLLLTVDQDYSLTAHFEERRYSHEENPGVAANDFLADTRFTELVVEVDYMEGYAPDSEALDSLELFLEQRLNKTSVTIQDPSAVSPGGHERYSAKDIQNLEREHRDSFTEDNRLSAYMLIVDGTYTQSNVLGIAYYNTSTAFFGAAYEKSSGGIGQASRYLIEAVTFRHEFGHLLGLVNIPGGTEMQQDHQDEAHGHHCTDKQCLMYYAMETTDLFAQLTGETIPALGPNCIYDLQENGGK